MKLWQKDKASLQEVEKFTVGNDREMDMYLAAFDVLGSLAHIETVSYTHLDVYKRQTKQYRNT